MYDNDVVELVISELTRKRTKDKNEKIVMCSCGDVHQGDNDVIPQKCKFPRIQKHMSADIIFRQLLPFKDMESCTSTVTLQLTGTICTRKIVKYSQRSMSPLLNIHSNPAENVHTVGCSTYYITRHATYVYVRTYTHTILTYSTSQIQAPHMYNILYEFVH